MTDFTLPFVIQDENDFWLAVSSWLRRKVRRWVYSASIARWCGQEEEVIDDIVGETLIRTFERLQLAAKGKAEPIVSIPQFSKTTAHNHFIDLTRREPRILCFSQLSNAQMEETVTEHHRANVEDIAVDVLFNESLFNLLAKEINLFPKRQKLALLIDLTRRLYFDTTPTLLQQAFLRVDVQLKDYQNFCPKNEVECRQFASLASQAYKRLAQLPSVKRYVS